MEHAKVELIIFMLIIGSVSNAADQKILAHSSPAQFRNRHVIKDNRHARSVDFVREHPLSTEAAAWIAKLEKMQQNSASNYDKTMIGSVKSRAIVAPQIDVQQEDELLKELLKEIQPSE